MKKILISVTLVTLIILLSLNQLVLATDNATLELEQEVDYGSLIKLKDIPYFDKLYDDYVMNNPNVTHEELNEYLKNEMLKFYSNKIDTNGYIEDYADLTQTERDLYNEDVSSGIKALSSAWTAQNATNDRYSSDYVHNDNGDAFRHAYWSCLMVKKIGYPMAVRWGTAHEDGYPNQPALEREMDLHNNAAGRILGQDNSNKSDSQMEELVFNAIAEGKRFVRIYNDSYLIFTNGDTGK